MSNTRTSVFQRLAMEEPISRFLKLPLKDIALRRVAIILCGNTDLLRFVAFINLTPAGKSPKENENAVKCMAQRNLSKLSLPESMKEEVLCLMKPLCREIAKWIHFHENFCRNFRLHCVNILKHLRWTPMGTVDYQRTAKELICHLKLDIDERYKLACLYCLPDFIRYLWGKMPAKCVGKKLWEREKGKISFYDDDSPLRVQQSEIVVYWTYMMIGREDRLNCFLECVENRYSSFYQYAFETVALKGYLTATKYFFDRITYEEMGVSLMRTVQAVANERSFDSGSYRQEYQKFSDVLFFLFTAMSEEQLLALLASHPFEVLKCCLDWPRQDLFIEVAEAAFSHLKEEDYCRLLFILSRNIDWGYDYANLFRKFFLVTPRRFRYYSLRAYGLFMRELFGVGDVETDKFIFRNLHAEEKMMLVFTNSAFGCCNYLITMDKWDWLELFFREAMLTKTDIVRFTTVFAARHPWGLADEGCQKFLQLLKSIDAPCSKRDKTTHRTLPPTADYPDRDLEKNPAKKHKKV